MSTSASTPVDSMPGTPGASTPGSVTDTEIDPLPTFTSLDLSLSRDQGTLHHRGYGAGSEAYSLSHVATSNHEKIAQRILSQSSVGYNAGGALSPENLPQAPKDLPQSPQQTNGEFLAPVTAPNSVGRQTEPSSTVATPGESRVGTPNLGQNPSTQTVQPSMAPPPAPSSGATNTSTIPARPAVTQKKSVFGKLFERGGNASQASLTSNGGATTPSTEEPAAADGGANLARKPSKKEREEAEKREKREIKEREKEAKELRKEQERERAPSVPRGRANSHGQKEKSEGLGQALNDFMKNKVQRKTSQSGKRSEDGKSAGGGSQAGDSEYGGSSKGNELRGSLSKKYGVCEKQVIGKGATATVKLAHKWDRSTERLYAVKEFRKRRKNETEKEYVKKLTSEFCISSTLHHHNVVETVDLVQDEQNHWCEVMEYCPGGDLYAAIKKGDMAPPEINSYFKQILAGVGYLHSMGVAHRDIKPENLLLDAKGHVKITDFGVSDVFRMCWEKTTHLSKGLCGSEPYIAPEQFEQKEYDARLVDIWACAIVFYCMHFQELPWRVAKPSDPSFGPYLQLYTGTSSPPPLSNLVPRECRNIIRKMLDPDPKTRARIDEILKDPWFESIKVIPAIEGIEILPKSGANSAISTPNPLASPVV